MVVIPEPRGWWTNSMTGWLCRGKYFAVSLLQPQTKRKGLLRSISEGKDFVGMTAKVGKKTEKWKK